jgi:thiol-disulfide isomerase/thioredoxin
MTTNNKIALITLLAIIASIYIRYLYHKPRLVNGDVAIEIKGVNHQGDSVRLTDLTGKYILLEFWGSWCAPCRKNNPVIVDLYQDYKEKKFRDADGFSVFYFALDDDEQSWRNAIIKDNLTWPYHMMGSGKFDNEIAGLYGIRSVPSSFLLGPDLTIIGVNPDERDIRKILDNRRID